MKLLDLYCGAGGAAEGYHRAGFTEIVGVDIAPQRHYPFVFIQGDALHPPIDLGGFDLIHTSPPCQVHSKTKHLAGRQHQDLVSQTRELLKASGKPFVIENVPGAPLIAPIALNGFMFDLPLDRERWFESSVQLPFVLLPHARKRPVKMGRKIVEGDIIQVVGHFSNVPYARKAMGIDWMSQHELSQAIPPAYTEWIGRQILEARCRRP
jgi:DNA (cytosine-5)-methyltransferase 1